MTGRPSALESVPGLLCLLALALLGPGRLAAETCTALQGGTWGPVDGGTTLWDCTDPGADDRFVIPASITVTVVDDVIQTAGANGGVIVESGGSLVARVTDRSLTLELSGVLRCRPGSSCELTGGYRELGVASPGVVTDFALAGHFFAGEQVPCPGDFGSGVEPDCPGNGTVRAGDPAVYRLSYPHARFDAANGTLTDEHVSEGLAAVEVGEVLCFFDPDLSDPIAPVDDGFCYEIVGSEADPAADPSFIEIDVRQTDPAAPRSTAYPLALREVGRTLLDQSVVPGERLVDVPSGTVADLTLYPGGVLEAERQYLGRWLRFGDGSDRALDEAYKIVRVLNDVTCAGGAGLCDRFVVGDPRGLRAAHTAGDEVWLDYGWSIGDPFFVMVPLVVVSATPNPLDSRMLLNGVVDVEAVLFDRTAGVDLSGATVQSWRNIWIRDAAHRSNGNGNALFVSGLTGALLERTSFTGGNPDLELDRRHTVGTSSLTDVTFRGVSIRHHGDDCYNHSFSATGMLIERLRCAFVALPAESANLYGTAPGSSWEGTVRDVACEDCTSIDAAPVMRPGVGGASVEGVLIWGAGVRTTPDFRASEAARGFLDTTTFSDLLSQGSSPTLPWLVDGFVVRDAIGADEQWLFEAEHLNVADGIVHDVVAGEPELAFGLADGTLDNVVLFDLDTSAPVCPGQCPILDAPAPGTAMTIRNLSFARTPGHATRFDTIFSLSGPEAGYLDAVTFDGVLMTGMTASSGLGEAIGGTAAQATNFLNSSDNAGLGPCFWDNVADVPVGTTLPASTLSGVDPGFVDPATGRFDLLPGGAGAAAGCGARLGVEGPGLSRYRWIHAIAGLVPERMADDPDEDGVPTDSGVASCVGGAMADCSDNCPADFNPGQADTDSDGVGDSCDNLCVGEPTVIRRLRRRRASPGRRVVVLADGIGAAPEVLFGDKPALIESRSGSRIEVRVPNLPIGEVVEVALANPEGCRSLNRRRFHVVASP